MGIVNFYNQSLTKPAESLDFVILVVLQRFFSRLIFSEDRTSALVIPVVSDLDIKGVIAPPIFLTTSSKSQCWGKPIFGLSLEVNLTTDVECFFSKSQVNCVLL